MKIKEVEHLLQMNSQTIRYYDKLGFLNPQRDQNGYRNYTLEDIKILKKIRFLRELDISLDAIRIILKNQNEFQNILAQHIKTLQIQVNNLEEIQQKCIELNQKNIPLLDAVVDGEFPDSAVVEDKQIKSIFKKAADFMQPYPVITIGQKTTPYQLIKLSLIFLFVIVFVSLAMLGYLKLETFINQISWGLWVLGVVIFWFGSMLIIFKEKYYEFSENDFYIFDSYKMKLKSIIAVLNNTTCKLARRYVYNDIDNVKIIVEKKLGGIGFGPVTYYNIIYQFHMLDGNIFEINSSLYHKNFQDRKCVYDILEYHHVKIIDPHNLKHAFAQNGLSMYEYLKKNYH